MTRVEQQAEGASSYTVYVLEVEAEDGRSWQLRRRFSDFARLRSALKAHAGPAGLAASWEELSKARSVTGAQRCRHCRAMPVVSRHDRTSRCAYSRHNHESM